MSSLRQFSQDVMQAGCGCGCGLAALGLLMVLVGGDVLLCLGLGAR